MFNAKVLFFMAKSQTKYHLHLKGYVGGYDFDSDYVDYILAKYPDSEVNVLIDSLGGSLVTALSIVAAFCILRSNVYHFSGKKLIDFGAL